MIALAPEDLADLRRWAICAAVVVLAHGGIAAAMVTWHEDDASAGPASAIVVEFAPVPRAASTPEAEVPPGPPQVASEASPNKPVETLEEREKVEQKVVEAKFDHKVEEKVETKPVEEPPPEVAPALNPEVAIDPPPPQEVKQEMAMRQSPSVASVASAPHVIAEEIAETPAAPSQNQLNPDDARAVVTWQKQIFALLKKNLRFPTGADRRGHAGTVQVTFSVDRQGRLTDSRIVRGTGVAELDDEALAVVKRSQPFPLPPLALTGERVAVNVPISFLPPGASAEKR